MNFRAPLLATAATLTLLSSGAVFAQEATPDTWMQAATSTLTRAEVQADLAAARQSGLIKAWSAGYNEPLRSQRLREQVKAETAQALASGEIKAINAEVYSFTPAAAQRMALAGR